MKNIKFINYLIENEFVTFEILKVKTLLDYDSIIKEILLLQNLGYDIEFDSSRGVKLNISDVINIDYLKKNTNENLNFIYFQTINSTNTYLKDNPQKNTVVIAREQIDGKGRFDRKFFSPKDTGIYFSIALDKKYINDITAKSSIIMSNVIDKLLNTKTSIKWVNDIYLNRKKISGSLAEVCSTNDNLIILGIGVNLYNPLSSFPIEIENTAGFLTKDKVSNLKNKIITNFLNDFFTNFNKDELLFKEYQNKLFILNENIYYKDNMYKVTKLNQDYSLEIINENKEKSTLKSGEVTIKIQNEN